jgi:hypothetical protein
MTSASAQSAKFPLLARWSAAVLVAAVIVVAALAQTGFGRSALRAAGLSAAPAGYTALSFASVARIPSQLYSQEALLQPSFVIRNASPADRTYSWVIVAVSGGGSHQVASGRTSVAAGASATVTRELLTSCAGAQLRLVVRLVAPRESIDYWLTCPGGPATAAPGAGQ